MPFAVAGVSLVVARLRRYSLIPAVASTMLIAAACQALGTPHRPYMRREDQSRANMTQAIDAIRKQVPQDDTIFVDFQTNFLLRFYLCPDAGFGVISAANFKEYSCRGYRVISTLSDNNILMADIFPRRWTDMLSAYKLNPGQTVWIFQAGWDANLARDLQAKSPQFHDLKPEFFGRNISLFKLPTERQRLAKCDF
jgi:hypothetical protein